MYAIVRVSHTAALTLGDINMAELNYVEVHDLPIEAGCISADVGEVWEIMDANSVTVQELCEHYFDTNFRYGSSHEVHSYQEEVQELIEYLNKVSPDNGGALNSATIRNWIHECNDLEILLEILSQVTADLFRTAQQTNQL